MRFVSLDDKNSVPTSFLSQRVIFVMTTRRNEFSGSRIMSSLPAEIAASEITHSGTTHSGTMDIVKELRLRRWARANYVAADERKKSWHPIVLDEMHAKDDELLINSRSRTIEVSFVPLAPTIIQRVHSPHANAKTFSTEKECPQKVQSNESKN